MGGVEVLSARLARGLRGDYGFVFFCLEETGVIGRGLVEDGVPVRVVGRRPGIDLGCVGRLARLLRDHRVDLIHAHTYGPFFYAATARLLGGRVPILYAEHARPFPDSPRLRHAVANRILLGTRDRVVGVGQAVRQAVIRNEGIPPERVEVVGNGIDVDAFTADPRARTDVRRELGLADEEPVAVQVARLDPIKDHVTAFHALGLAARRVGNLRLVVVGDGALAGPLRRLADGLGLGAHVRFLGLRTDVSRLLSAADVFLLSSLSEAAPVSVMEAMASGLAVVATRVGGVGELVADGETGLLSPPGHPEPLAGNLARLADDPVLRRRMGRAGRRRALEAFSEGTMLRRYRSIYDEMLGRPPEPGSSLRSYPQPRGGTDEKLRHGTRSPC